MTYSHRHITTILRVRLLAATVALVATLGVATAAVAPNDPPDLSNAPADLSIGVNPNIFVSFDDSGSMAQTVMGDFAPFTGSSTSSWAGPWRCANVIDPDHRTAADAKMRSTPMNGVYYNPNTVYSPPIREDGTPFPLTVDSTLAAVFVDGVAVGRPFNAVSASGTIAFNNNTDVSGGSNDTGRTNIMGTKTTSGGTTIDNRWKCGTGARVQNSGGAYTAASPMDGASHTLSDGTTVTYPNGGPYYFRLKTTVVVNLNPFGKPATSTDLNNLYNANNWEAVPVPVSQYQNFANWYAYYRTRTQMARTALSRVFGVIGTPTKANIRVTWQNLGNNTNLNWVPASGTSGGTNAPSVNIVELDDNTPYTGPNATSGNNTWRQAFFNWIFNVKASNGTPSRSALLRVGKYFQRGQGITDLSNPYYQPASSNSSGRELACRQNYHILMTDGLYNQPSVSTSPTAGYNTQTLAGIDLPGTPLNTTNITHYDPNAPESKLYSHGTNWTLDADGGATYSDLAFYYWATNLRPDFLGNPQTQNDSVAPYYPDTTTGVTGAVATVDPNNPGRTPEVFWNPANDPATWPHLVQFAVTLGAFGDLTFSSNTDCQNGATVTNDDACALRKGVTNSTGAVGWKQPNGSGSGINANIDDLWHAALNARGQFFVATSPQSLVTRLTKILANVVARSGSSVSESVNSSILNNGSFAYSVGYNSAGWPGYLYKQAINPYPPGDPRNPLNLPIGAPSGPILWDAGCFLTGGACTKTGSPNVGPPTPSYASRVIFTSIGSPGALSGAPFEWGSLGATEQSSLNLDPTTTWPDQVTTQIINGGVANGTSDGLGSVRMDYLRGRRTNETIATSTGITFRQRLSVLGAIINSQAVYEGAPSGGFSDIYPVGSPEQIAAGAGNSYERFVTSHLTRTPTLYVGANDGMMHAFNAGTGAEMWAYVPNPLYANGQLGQLTNAANALIPTVDDSPLTQDVFINGSWHTILVGGLRLGGRGIYALDVTNPDASTEGVAATKFMWEFSSGQDADLGYSYASTNIARLHNGKWVVLVTSGYFPKCLPSASATSSCFNNGHDGTDLAAGATSRAAGPTYLWVLDAANGSQIAKIPTRNATSYGLGTPGVVDFNLDQIDDVVTVGDLAGNLWRFDLSDTTPANWTNGVDVMFQSYDNTSACSTSNTRGIGCEPITVMPVAFPDTSGVGSVIYVFGSGQYLGASDNNVSSSFPTQNFFGVRDYGTHFSGSDGGAAYPFHEANLTANTLTQTGSLRYLAPGTPPSFSRGWRIPLNVSGVLGERDVATAFPVYSTGVAVLTSLIPGQNQDPCQPGRSGAVMAVDANTGVGPVLPSGAPSTGNAVGGLVSNPPTVGGITALSSIGGGSIVLPGLNDSGGSPLILNGYVPFWRRSSWNELLNQL